MMSPPLLLLHSLFLSSWVVDHQVGILDLFLQVFDGRDRKNGPGYISSIMDTDGSQKVSLKERILIDDPYWLQCIINLNPFFLQERILKPKFELFEPWLKIKFKPCITNGPYSSFFSIFS